jgi:hypothetical protein
MTQDKHTPGPWFVTPDGYRVTDKNVALDDSGARHGETPNIVIFAETKANARLIAAAPDLLDALRATLGELLCVRDYIDDASRGQLRYRGASDLSEMAGDDLTRLDEQIATVRAVIACATGEAAE